MDKKSRDKMTHRTWREKRTTNTYTNPLMRQAFETPLSSCGVDMVHRNKKGIELSMNVIVIAILVILVLLFVALFFSVGFSDITNKIKQIFQGKAIDIGIIKSNCDGFCSSYSIISGESSKQDLWNEYCTVDRKVDLNSNG